MLLTRHLTKTDIESIIPHYLDYFNLVEGAIWSEKTIERRLRQLIIREDQVGLILLDNESFIGFVTGQLMQFDDGLIYELNELFISRSKQRKGYGTFLLKAIENLAKEKGALRLQLQAGDDRAHRHFYLTMHTYQIANNNLLLSKGL